MNRITLRQKWLDAELKKLNITDIAEIISLPGDASFRQYFRIVTKEKNYLLMDAPPELENSHRFVAIAEIYRAQHVMTPKILAKNLVDGFLLIEDFGQTLLSDALTPGNVDRLYRQCYEELPKIQRCETISGFSLPGFVDELLEKELNSFKEWCISKFAQLTLSFEEEQLLQNTFLKIKKVCAEQPQVGVHRDYHSRNLMIIENNAIGVLDFQDAVIGPITYDLVSLLRDCYVTWPDEQVKAWVKDYYERFGDQKKYSLEQFQRWFDWQGLQRHLKAIFIFCRKYLRDGSINYLNDIPRTLNYVRYVTQQYPELKAFHQFIEYRLVPVLLDQIEAILKHSLQS